MDEHGTDALYSCPEPEDPHAKRVILRALAELAVHDEIANAAKARIEQGKPWGDAVADALRYMADDRKRLLDAVMDREMKRPPEPIRASVCSVCLTAPADLDGYCSRWCAQRAI